MSLSRRNFGVLQNSHCQAQIAEVLPSEHGASPDFDVLQNRYAQAENRRDSWAVSTTF
jgi:hypothetical protein